MTQTTFQPNRLRRALSDKGMTQERLARELDLSLSAVNQWARGTTDPRGRQLIRMAQILERDPAWFYEQNGVAA